MMEFILASMVSLAPRLEKQELQFSSSVIHIASYDVQERIKELGGGPFCINPLR